jgi:YD repeat-containing protein
MSDPDFDPTAIPLGYTRDAAGRVLSYRDESGFWFAYTYDDDGHVVTCVNSDGHWYNYVDDATTTANAQLHIRGRQHD